MYCGIKMPIARDRTRPARPQRGEPKKQWGGKRAGAGRKPNGPVAMVSHDPRPPFAARFPVHVTVKLVSGLPKLRNEATYAVLCGAFGIAADRFGFRLVHYSVRDDQMFWIIEAADREAMSRGVQGLMVRIARGLNRHWRRCGRVFADRYLDRVLRTPLEVKQALRDVLRGVAPKATGFDPFSSAAWFDGFRDAAVPGRSTGDRPVAAARTRLLRVGWRRHGLLSTTAADA
jgi:hypothetical protein